VVAEHGKPVGILTENDIPHLLTRNIHLNARIDSIMTARPPVISHTMTSYEALQCLRKDTHHHLVVVRDDGSMAGVLSRSDFTKGLVKQHIDDLQNTIERQQDELIAAKLELADIKQQAAENRYLALSMDEQGMVIEWNPAAECMFGYSRLETIGRELADFILPPDLREKHRSSLRKQVDTGDGSTLGKVIEVNGIHADGHKVPVELTIARVQTNGDIVFTAFLRDITERQQREKKLRKRRQQLSHLANASRQINSILESSHIMRALVGEAIEMVNAESGAAGVFVEGRMQFHEYVQGKQRIAIDMGFELGDGVPGWVMEHKRPYVSDDAEHDPHVIPDIQKELGFYKLVDVPILSRQGDLLGCFEMHDRKDGLPFDAEDVEMLQSLAATAAVALENAQMVQEIKHLNLAIEQANDIILTWIEMVTY